MKFTIKDFFCKCDQILKGKLHFCAVSYPNKTAIQKRIWTQVLKFLCLGWKGCRLKGWKNVQVGRVADLERCNTHIPVKCFFLRIETKIKKLLNSTKRCFESLKQTLCLVNFIYCFRKKLHKVF